MQGESSPLFWPILAGALIILANAFFVTVEFALVTVRRGQLERLAEDGNPRAGTVLGLLENPDWAIAGSQLGITVASILLGIVAEEPLSRLMEPTLSALFGRFDLPAGVAAGLAGILVLLLLSFFHMVLGEQTPKTIALRYPTRSALVVGPPMALFAKVAAPLVWLVDRSTAIVLKLLGVGGQTGGHGIHTVEELRDVVRESQQGGVISTVDEALLLRAMAFGDRFVREAMIPRTDIVAVDKDATLGELIQVFKTSSHSRFPVFEEDLDNICGVVNIKEVLPVLADDPSSLNKTLAELDLIRPAMVVPESRRIGDLFAEMGRDQRHMAILIDEFGGTAGLVTTEELAEQVVGRLIDEWVTEGPSVSPLAGGAFEIDAQTGVAEVNEALRIDLPTSPDYETLAGFLLFLLRRIPRAGEVVEHGDLRFRITQMAGPKIERVQVEQSGEPSPAEAGG